jgi:hypothetical protein
MRIHTPRSLALGGLACLALLAAGCADQAPPLEPGAAHPLAAAGGPHVVQVAPPVGNSAADRASILEALEEVGSGGTLQFAPGTYVIGVTDPFSFAYLRVTVPRLTLRGHPEGTTLQGCEPAEVEWGNCVGLWLSGGAQTVRDLHFVDMTIPLLVGRQPWVPEPTPVGGYRVEDSSFRNSIWGVLVVGQWPQPTIIRNNAFVNLEIPVDVWGSRTHVLDNHISAPEPGRIPDHGTPFVAVTALAAHALFETGPCEHNVIAGNRVEGYHYGILIEAFAPGAGCRHNVIRDNTLTEIGTLTAGAAVFLLNSSAQEGLVEQNLVQGNRLEGVDGTGVALHSTNRNRVVNNTLVDVRPSELAGWIGAGNGSGVWVSAGSDENQILANSFSAIAASSAVLEGDHNHVATRSASDVVRDLGVGNRVTGPGSVVHFAAPAGTRADAATTAAERARAERMLRERFGARGSLLLGREAAREGAPR